MGSRKNISTTCPFCYNNFQDAFHACSYSDNVISYISCEIHNKKDNFSEYLIGFNHKNSRYYFDGLIFNFSYESRLLIGYNPIWIGEYSYFPDVKNKVLKLLTLKVFL